MGKKKKLKKSEKQEKLKKQKHKGEKAEKKLEKKNSIRQRPDPEEAHTGTEELVVPEIGIEEQKPDAADPPVLEFSRRVQVPDQDMAEVLKAFGDSSRLQILDLLQGRELCASELLKSMDIVQSTLSHHMKILTESGVVRCRRQGRSTYYSIDRDILVKVSEYIIKWS